MTSNDPPFAGPLRACARGIYADEAGVELLIDHAVFLHRGDFRERFIDVDTNIADGSQTQLAAVNWPDAISALGTGELRCSSGEERMLRLAASLANGLPVSLRDALTGLDDRNANLVIKAMWHAAGHPPNQQIP